VKGLSQCNPQIEWVKGIKMDFIGRFENLQDDFNIIARKLGIDEIELPHLRKSQRKSFEDYYCKESLKIINRLYKQDFDVFGYPLQRWL
jgi:hypothetical protein